MAEVLLWGLEAGLELAPLIRGLGTHMLGISGYEGSEVRQGVTFDT